MRKILFVLACAFLLVSCGKDYSVKGNQVLVHCSESGVETWVRLQVISPEIIRVSALPSRHFVDRKSLAVVSQQGCRHFEVN